MADDLNQLEKEAEHTDQIAKANRQKAEEARFVVMKSLILAYSQNSPGDSSM